MGGAGQGKTKGGERGDEKHGIESTAEMLSRAEMLKVNVFFFSLSSI